MNGLIEKTELFDNGGRRSGIERREFSYSGYYPERRSGIDRRNGTDRRSMREERKTGSDRNGNYTMRSMDRRKNLDMG